MNSTNDQQSSAQSNQPQNEYMIKTIPSLEDILKQSKPTSFQIIAQNVNTNEIDGTYNLYNPTIKPTTTSSSYEYSFCMLRSNKPRKQIPRQLINKASEVLQDIANNTKTEIIHAPFVRRIQEGNIAPKSKALLNIYESLGYERVKNHKYSKTYFPNKP